MEKVSEHIYVGSLQDCFHKRTGWAVVHACKTPCHTVACDYAGSLPKSHPNYLHKEVEDNLYLNIIDPDTPLFMPGTFEKYFEFFQARDSLGMEILIHCNQGGSRAPSLALLAMAIARKEISSESFAIARAEFSRIYPSYSPGLGIQIYLGNNWKKLHGFRT